jgi:hypothetical protein
MISDWIVSFSMWQVLIANRMEKTVFWLLIGRARDDMES